MTLSLMLSLDDETKTISLWDHPADDIKGERYVPLELTSEQVRTLGIDASWNVLRSDGSYRDRAEVHGVVLVKGKRYLVTYQIPGVHRKPWVMVAAYIGMAHEQAQFSLRPKAGTQQLRFDHILRAEEVSDITPCEVPRRTR